MGFFSRSSSSSSSGDCERSGGHDQRMHTRDKGTPNERTVVDCQPCGKEWAYDKNGNRK